MLICQYLAVGFCLFLLSVTAVAQSSEVMTAPPGGRAVLENVLANLTPQSNNNGRSEVVSVNDAPGFTQAIRFSIDKATQPWNVMRGIAIPRDIAKGETYLIGFWARTLSTRHESQQGIMSVEVAETDSPHRKVAGGTVTFPFTWRQYWMRGSAPVDMKQGKVTLKLFAGEAAQEVEIGGIQVLTYGVGYDVKHLPFSRFTYVGRELDAPWRQAAQERIEKLRMAPLQVRVIDRAGKPVPGAEVAIAQTRSAFKFGIEYAAGRIMDRSKPEAEIYRQKLPQLFNAVVFGNDLKWEPRLGDWGPSFSQEQTLAALKWARSQELFIRGHVMVWPGTSKDWGNLPKFIKEMKNKNPDPAAIQQLVLSRIDEVAGATAGYIDEWDVMNEPRDNHALIDLCGKPAMAQWFKRAKERLPHVPLAVNEYSILSALTDSPAHDTYENYIRDLQQNGAPLDVIGMQGYFGMLVPTPERMLKTLDRFAALGPAIRVTEYHIKGEDEDLKCDFTRDLLTVLYSHEKVIGFHTWYGLQNYINPDGSYTRMGQTLDSLINHAWKTRAKLATNAQGRCAVPAHLGRYSVIVRLGDRATTMWLDHRKDSPELLVTLP